MQGKEMKKNIVIIGLPGSGKGTICLELKKLEYTHISTGDLLRIEVASGSELGKEIAARIDNGLMVDDQLSLKVMKEAMNKSNGSCLFDGYPRNLIQAKLLETELIDNDLDNLIILHLDIDKSLLQERIINRLTCPKCDNIFNLKDKIPKIEDSKYLCSSCDVELSKRKDDNEESLNTRLKVFDEKTKAVIDYYSQFKKYYKIDANKSREDILSNILNLIK
jgi:adenylate kinase